MPLRMQHDTRSKLHEHILKAYEHESTPESCAEEIFETFRNQHRPKPSLSMIPTEPYKKGKPNKGYQALVTTSHEEYKSDEWCGALKTNITCWGRVYVGPYANKVWLDHVRGKKKNKTEVMKDQISADRPITSEGEPLPPQEEDETIVKESILEEGADQDVPVPIGMKGNILLFDCVPCKWETSFGVYNSEEDEKNRKSPLLLFTLLPIGSGFKVVRLHLGANTHPSPETCLRNLVHALDTRWFNSARDLW